VITNIVLTKRIMIEWNQIWKNTEKIYLNAAIRQNLTMLMACAKIVIMLKAELRKLTYVLIQKELFMLKVFARTVIWVPTIGWKGCVPHKIERTPLMRTRLWNKKTTSLIKTSLRTPRNLNEPMTHLTYYPLKILPSILYTIVYIDPKMFCEV